MKHVYILVLCLSLIMGCRYYPKTQVTQAECYWNWGTTSLPELSHQWQVALDDANLGTTRAYAEGYGEGCNTPDTVDTYGILQTDFYVTIPVRDLDDLEELGNLCEKMLEVLDTLPPESIPVAMEDVGIDLTFTESEESRKLWFDIGHAREAQMELSGAALFNELAPACSPDC